MVLLTVEILSRWCDAKPQDDTYWLLKVSGIAPHDLSTVFPTPDNFKNTVLFREVEVMFWDWAKWRNKAVSQRVERCLT